MYDTVLLDIDGTLCDPGRSILTAAQHALRQLGVDEHDEAALRRFVGPPLEPSFRDYYGFAEPDVQAAVMHYREHFSDHGMAEYRPYPGIAEALEELRGRGLRLAVVTAKIQPFAEQALRTTGLLGFFELVSGRAPDEVVEKSVTLRAALARLSPAPANPVMVGDRRHDVEAARANDIESIGVLYGYGTREELEHAGATHLAAVPADIVDVVAGRS
ncbi:HAD hydrolase-like protein [Actinotalea subterranea]|uniref:HAD hydrolase-like protein n=1 Tax=Actinotalea subterranea TaxID=2607497 RepID=UPI0011F02BBE|nr:HAD hydrolase-like protein [Actinotalea subterranea]